MSTEWRQEIQPPNEAPRKPKGVFLVAFMEVKNLGLESDSVGLHGCTFLAQDSAGRRFDMADLDEQWAAQQEWDCESVYDTIQPGFTARMVFVFDVLPESEDISIVTDCS